MRCPSFGCLVVSLVVATTSPPVLAAPAAEDAKLAATSGSASHFQFSPKSRPALKVWLAMPAEVRPDTPIVFALHGMSRSAEAVRDAWAPAALARKMIVVTPHFDVKGYPRSVDYNLGKTHDRKGKPLPSSEWTFMVIEEIFDAVKTRTGSQVPDYSLYGHSAGAQFAHRMLLLMPTARVRQVVSANAGYYLMPDASPAPYGMQATGVAPEHTCRAYAIPMVILLGNDDDDPTHHQLNNTPGAKAQGAHRVARGWQFYSATKRDAAARKCPYRWSVQTVVGAGHDFDKMAVAAAALLP